ncbi:iron-containing alcohol dehydrogenase [Varunaivibrio sulfuroxidans]|nr:iron-containing alcohol dehydrogenase [Varunaivibrio sulfuroxidans]WES30298.1 iron-containing alcohol dehydrogenase [Varunaivibrio sulfuroxidans]
MPSPRAPLPPFTIARLPRLVFGAGTIAQLPGEIAALGRRVLIVTGGRSFMEGPHCAPLLAEVTRSGAKYFQLAIAGEPSPELIDDAVRQYKGAGVEAVVGIGGGSALDGAKAIAGLLTSGDSVMDFLEGVGPERPYRGPALPFIAVPTTAGTGSEATKNAVLGRHGPEGFKKSFRSDALVARLAIVDPDLLFSCPKSVVAANAMDAFTQLLESLVSTRANVMTRALAWSGLEAFNDGLWTAWRSADGDTPTPRRSHALQRLAYAAMISGICLAQTGLGSVHGLAAPLGAFFQIPHGVACAAVLAAATMVNIEALRERDPENPALDLYARAGTLIGGGEDDTPPGDPLEALCVTLRGWTETLNIPRLGHFGVGPDDIARLVANSRGSSMKTNPVALSDAEIAAIVRRSL